MKKKLPRTIFLPVLGFLFLCALATIVELRFKIMQRGYDNFVLDNRNHYLPCRDLPARIEVERMMAQHQDAIQQIQQVAPGAIGIEIDSLNCEGKADVLIWYGTHQQRVEIEKIIGGDTFFGIPYRLQNR
jgi:hypothetical protein